MQLSEEKVASLLIRLISFCKNLRFLIDDDKLIIQVMKCNMRNLIRLGFLPFYRSCCPCRTSGHINIAQLDALHLTLIRKDDQLGSILREMQALDNFIQDQIHCLHTLERGEVSGMRDTGYRLTKPFFDAIRISS